MRALCLLLLLAPAIAAARDNGHELLTQCEAAIAAHDGTGPADPQAAAWCTGFVTGVTNLASIAYYVKPDGQMFCPPDGGIDPRQATRVLVDYLRAHPDRLHARKVTLAAAAFMGAYPCDATAARPGLEGNGEPAGTPPTPGEPDAPAR